MKKDGEDRAPAAYSLGSVYTSSLVNFVLVVYLLLALILGDGLAPSLSVAVAVLYFFMDISAAYRLSLKSSSDQGMSNFKVHLINQIRLHFVNLNNRTEEQMPTDLNLVSHPENLVSKQINKGSKACLLLSGNSFQTWEALVAHLVGSLTCIWKVTNYKVRRFYPDEVMKNKQRKA